MVLDDDHLATKRRGRLLRVARTEDRESLGGEEQRRRQNYCDFHIHSGRCIYHAGGVFGNTFLPFDFFTRPGLSDEIGAFSLFTKSSRRLHLQRVSTTAVQMSILPRCRFVSARRRLDSRILLLSAGGRGDFLRRAFSRAAISRARSLCCSCSIASSKRSRANFRFCA